MSKQLKHYRFCDWLKCKVCSITDTLFYRQKDRKGVWRFEAICRMCYNARRNDYRHKGEE